jgi:hypothetical protein
MESSDDSSKNFFKHVFNFDDDSKADLLNIIQYSMISIIPVVLLNKSIQRYVPEADDQKGSLEVLAEIIIQVIVMFTGLLMVHRMATFLPTYSGVKYPEFSIIFIILAVLMIALSLQTKLGEKVSILTERVTELWEGKSDKKKKKGNVKVSQPISQNGQMISTQNQAAMNQAIYTDGTSINSLPSNNETQQMPNYDAMHRQDNTPLVNAASPSMEGSYMEPMAANSALGGFGGFSAW